MKKVDDLSYNSIHLYRYIVHGNFCFLYKQSMFMYFIHAFLFCVC
jgi:hypothetical protein